MHDIAGPLLYKTPAVRSLPAFLSGVFNPGVGGVYSKLQLLNRTERLFLDFSHGAGDRLSVSPEEVAGHLAEKEDVIDTPDLRDVILRIREAEGILRAWETILPDRVNEVFPKLRTFSTGGMTGLQRGVSWPKADYSVKWGSLLGDCQEAVLRFAQECLSLQRVCQTPGLLSWDDDTLFFPCRQGPPGVEYSISTHSSIQSPELRPCCIGRRTSWIVHTYDDWLDGSQDDEASSDTRQHVRNLLDMRRQHASDPKYTAQLPSDSPAWNITGGLYLGIPEAEADPEREAQKIKWGESAKYEQGLIDEILAAGKEGLPEGMEVQDRWEMKTLLDARCAACGWSGETARRPVGWTRYLIDNAHRFP